MTTKNLRLGIRIAEAAAAHAETLTYGDDWFSGGLGDGAKPAVANAFVLGVQWAAQNLDERELQQCAAPKVPQ